MDRLDNSILSGSGEIDTLMLDTDVQRFFYIITLLLAMIFALVQSMPLANEDTTKIIGNLKKQIMQQNNVLEKLRQENENFKHLANNIDKTIGEKKELKRKIEEQKKDIERLLSQKNETEMSKKELAERGKEIERLKSENDKLRKKLQDKSDSETQSDPVETDNSFRVAFDSDEAFLSLLNQDQIRLFIKPEGVDKGFRAIMKADQAITFNHESRSEDYNWWDLDESLIPIEILKAFKSWTTLYSRNKSVYIGLTQSISKQIEKISAQGGALMIDINGNVYIKGGK